MLFKNTKFQINQSLFKVPIKDLQYNKALKILISQMNEEFGFDIEEVILFFYI